ncbi:ABC-F family ATP-binding cassette domain-containing protein [Amaricoccus solimangrovi]|uniref:ATP-binding cassette domain-containing protein n=1 Tax=Amaricoccus solimangrovi TaxID=2589815 RepID=A0A501WY45_9RHOB|nr:ATP-binding cassette domain-containing protein [Amaricoccus solimangrovi]TPE53662.1 ATP-binding cassette domain-containing protein [Amaricoccus solimangrovi]
MAEPPILTLADIALTFGGDPLFSNLALSVHPGERIALVGRNGSGKSTLLRIMAGLTLPDSGARFLRPGLTVGYMAQDPDFGGYATLGDFAGAHVDPAEHWRVEMAMEGVKLDPSLAPEAASGGERRRAALAKILAEAPDLMLLDEPTNHLDIAAIAWLEGWLRETRTAFVVISHDRAFLRELTDRVLWVDRGEVRRLDRGFAAFEEWRDKVYEEEDQQRHKLNRLIKAEARWAVEGISARRKRNQGRVRRLADLRAERSAQIARTGTAKMEFESATRSGKLVVDAEHVSKGYGERVILRDFSIRVNRGERIALVGPNGVGKTTLLGILTGRIAPDGGKVRLGTNLVPALFDQNRQELRDDVSLWETLTGDAELGVSGRNDQVMVRGRPRHVVGYLKEFLFPEIQARGPVSALSGGERARLLLAKLMAKDSNLLILDEPTNDLDVETLDLLQELIDDYEGTVLVVSHDRDFVDRVATTTVAMEGDGRATIYAGGWSDYQAQRPPDAGPEPKAEPKPARAAPREAPKPKPRGKLGFAETHRLETLPGEIDRLTAEIGKLEALLADPALFTREPAKFRKATDALVARQGALHAAEEEWLRLEALREEIEG